MSKLPFHGLTFLFWDQSNKQRKLMEPNAIQAGATVVGKPTKNPDGSYMTLNSVVTHVM